MVGLRLNCNFKSIWSITYKSPGVLVVGDDGLLHDLGHGVDDVLRYEVIGEALAQVQRLVVKGHLNEFNPESK